MTTSRSFTHAEIAAANDTDLVDLLSYLGYHVRPIGRYHTTREMDSIRIKDRRTWFRYSESVGGDAIAFLRHFEGKTFQEAVDFLLAWNGREAPDPPPIRRTRPPPSQERSPFVLPPRNGNNERVYTYLRGRGIGPSVIASFIDMGLLYEGSEHHNCIFVGRDGTGTPVFAAKRGTWGVFKGDVAGSDKRIAFRLPCCPELADVRVFESAIDIMSWLTLYGRPVSNAIALCGLHDGPLETYLDENPHIRRIILSLDADGPGREATNRISAKHQALGYEIETGFPPAGKDWNEYLQSAAD